MTMKTSKTAEVCRSVSVKRHPCFYYFLALVCAGLIAAPEAARAAIVTYTQQQGNYQNTVTSGTSGTFDNGSTEMGMYAHGGDNKNVATWRTLKTAGNNTGSNRSLQVGDIFRINGAATRAFGQIGFSLNAGGTQGASYANNISGSRLYCNTDNYGAWYINRSGGNTTFGSGYNPIQDTYKDYNFTIRITSETTADAYLTVDGTDYRAYNLTMNGSAGANIDAYSVYFSDDWDGNSNDNLYWKQTSNIENSGVVQLGYFLTSGTFTPGKITDGLAADSTSTASVNALFVGGDSGSAVVLASNNTYTGASTVNANATARLEHTNGFGTTAGGVSVTSGGRIQIGGGITVGSEALTLNGSGISASGALQNTNGNNTWSGTITLGSGSTVASDTSTLTLSTVTNSGFRLTVSGAGTTSVTNLYGNGDILKQGSGTLSLNVSNSFGGTNAMFMDKGTVQLGASGAAGTNSGYVNVGASGAGAAGDCSLLITASSVTISNPVDIRYFSAASGGKTIGGNNASGTATFTGNIALHDTATFTAASGGTVSFSGAVAITGGQTGSETNAATVLFDAGPGIIKSGAGTVEFSGNNSGFINETWVKDGTLQYNGTGSYPSKIRLGDTNTAATATATVNIANASGGGTVSGLINVRQGGGGTKTISASNTSGTNTYSGNNFLDADATTLSSNSGATLAFTGSTFDIKNKALTVSGSGNTVISSGIFSSTAGGTVTKTGSGRMTLSGTSSYTGATTVSNGTLIVSGVTASSVVTVKSGATIGGTGNIGGALTVESGATIAPGSSIGTLTLSNSPSLSGVTLLEIDRTNSPNADKLVVLSGGLTYGGTMTVTNIGNAPAGGDVFTLFSTSSYSGSFSSTTLPSLGAGLNWYQGNLTNNGTLVVNRSPTAGTITYYRPSGVSYKIKISDLITNVSDADLDAVTFVDNGAATTNGLTITGNATYIFVPTNNVNDAFTFRARDDRGGTNTLTVKITIASVTGQGQTVTLGTNSTVTATFYGIPGSTYVAQRATNVFFTLGFTNLSTNIAPANGVFDVTDNFSDLGAVPDSAFYRLLAP